MIGPGRHIKAGPHRSGTSTEDRRISGYGGFLLPKILGGLRRGGNERKSCLKNGEGIKKSLVNSVDTYFPFQALTNPGLSHWGDTR
jgi:hypothetical protein